MSEQDDQADIEQAARADQADIEDQMDAELQTDGGDPDRGDRGRRGIQGRRGPAGADSESIEVLTQVLDKLTDELVRLSKYVYGERKGRRLSMAVIAVALTVAVIVGAIGFANYRGLADRQDADRRQQMLFSATSRYDQKVGLHEACGRSNDNRASRRRLFVKLYDLLESTVPATPRTPAEQAVVDGFLKQARADVNAETDPVSCDVEAPLPAGDRPS